MWEVTQRDPCVKGYDGHSQSTDLMKQLKILIFSGHRLNDKISSLAMYDCMSIFHTCFKELLKISMKQVLTNY